MTKVVVLQWWSFAVMIVLDFHQRIHTLVMFSNVKHCDGEMKIVMYTWMFLLFQ